MYWRINTIFSLKKCYFWNLLETNNDEIRKKSNDVTIIGKSIINIINLSRQTS